MIRIGTAGWSYPDWDGIVYPRPKPRGFHALPFLAQFMDCVEINSSFYAMPVARHARKWVELVQDRPKFRFLAKLNKIFTHAEPLPESAHGKAVDEFRAGLQPLLDSGKFSALLMQFPAHFKATKAASQHVQRLVRDWPELPVAIELRHRSWFVPEGLAWLKSLGAALLHVDMPSAATHPPAEFSPTSGLGYLRLHGRNSATWFKPGVGRDDRYNYLYSPGEVEELAKKVERMTSEYDDVYVVTNNHFAGQAVANAVELQARLGVQPVSAPAGLIAHYPRLNGIARALGQQNLF